MAGMNGAGMLLPEPAANLAAPLSAGQLFKTIAWLRWRIFVNTLRGKGAAGELFVKIMSYPVLAIIIVGPSLGAGFGAFYFVHQGMDAFLAIPLWIIFALWQFIGISTSATGPSFDLNSLIRFPIGYRDYFLMRLSFGLLDPPTLAGIGCLLATGIGIGIAAPAMLPWSLVALLVYAACNVLFSRMVYSWLERWLAQRKTRELLTGLILVFSLGIQVASQFVSRFSASGHHAPPSPWMQQAAHILLAINWVLPPGLTASAIAQMHGGFPLIALAAFGGLILYAMGFLYILNVRLHAQYLGENLSEAPAAKAKIALRKTRPATVSSPRTSAAPALLNSALAALLIKDFRLLLRSGTKLYSLVMPVFVLFLFSFRTAGLEHAGVGHGSMSTYLFSYGCAYAQLIFVAMLYNALGTDGAGVQFYFIAPLRMRDVMLAKNLLTVAILVIEVALMYGASLVLHAHTPNALVAATLAWCAFAFLLNMGIGNVRSLVSPKWYNPGQVRRQNVSGFNSFISLAVVFAATGLGWLGIFLCRMLEVSYWNAAGAFVVLAVLAFGMYVLILGNLDGIAAKHAEEMTRELSKTA